MLCKKGSYREVEAAVLKVVYEAEAVEGHFQKDQRQQQDTFLLDKKINC